MTANGSAHSFLQSPFLVDIPSPPELTLPKAEFEAYINSLVKKNHDTTTPIPSGNDEVEEKKSPFMTRLLATEATIPSLDSRDGKMLTEKGDVAYSESGSTLVDLFYELEEHVSALRLSKLLTAAWQEDSEATLKIIWNARSIHLGKSSRNAFYRAAGWLYQEHPATLIVNLPWLVRPLILKKAAKKENKTSEDAASKETATMEDQDSDFEIVHDESDTVPMVTSDQRASQIEQDGDAPFDVKYGVSHGYWKDLLNILVLASVGELKVDCDAAAVFNVKTEKKKTKKKVETQIEPNLTSTPGTKKALNDERYTRVVEKLRTDPTYKALHFTVARLFADQLRLDSARLESKNKKEMKKITLCGKWAPSNKSAHDQYTRIVSTIVELLYPFNTVCPDADPSDRTLYLKHARIAYQMKTLSPLRKHLQIVERPISANKFDEIQYDRVPSLAMRRYTPLFATKDFDRFDHYLENVAQGHSQISGAVLLPSNLVAEALQYSTPPATKPAQPLQAKIASLQIKRLNAQWDTLVHRLRSSTASSTPLTSAIAICDVSGSMTTPRFPDHTTPMDSAIGLSLLLAELTAPPFGGALITFSTDPAVIRVGGPTDPRPFAEKVAAVRRAPWGGSTDFVAVFRRLLLPMARDHRLAPADMVDKVFVFSDMHFDQAQREDPGGGGGGDDEARARNWTSSYDRVKAEFAADGYRVPELVFWNLASGRNGEPAPKPVDAGEQAAVLVSGYSQAQMKMFLDRGGDVGGDDADADGDHVRVVDGEPEWAEVVVSGRAAAREKNPLAAVRDAIAHEAYRMLSVVD